MKYLKLEGDNFLEFLPIDEMGNFYQEDKVLGIEHQGRMREFLFPDVIDALKAFHDVKKAKGKMICVN